MKRNYLEVLMEEMRDQFGVVLDALGVLQEKVNNLPTRDEFNQDMRGQ